MSSANRRSRSHSTLASPTNPSSKRSISSTTSPRTMVFNRGKRARRDSSASSRLHSIIIPVTSSSSISGSSTANPLASVPTNLTSSAPPTPLFPSTSAAFFLSGQRSDFHVQRDAPMHSAQHLPPSPRPNLHDLHREAFTSLRQSVAESGEGFVRRMREWEQRRHVESSKLSTLGADRERERRRDRGRGRKARNSRMDHRPSVGHSSINTRAESRQAFSYLQGGEQGIDGRHLSFGAQETDDEYDILLESSPPVAFGVEQLQRKRRAASLGDPMDVIDSPELFDVEIANSDEEVYPDSQFTTLDFPFTYSNTRSSSPFSFINTSDDESSYAHTHSGFSSPRAMRNSIDWSKNSNSPQTHSGFRHLHLGDSVEYDVPETSQPSASPISNPHLLSASSQSRSMSQIYSPGSSRVSSHKSPKTASEKAVAALALALANGSGSLADYGSVREAQGDLQELEAGALWD